MNTRNILTILVTAFAMVLNACTTSKTADNNQPEEKQYTFAFEAFEHDNFHNCMADSWDGVDFEFTFEFGMSEDFGYCIRAKVPYGVESGYNRIGKGSFVISMLPNEHTSPIVAEYADSTDTYFFYKVDDTFYDEWQQTIKDRAAGADKYYALAYEFRYMEWDEKQMIMDGATNCKDYQIGDDYVVGSILDKK